MMKVSFFTLGCKVNQFDTQSIRESFLRRGFVESAGSGNDWCVINTCTVTAKADAKSRNIIRHLIKKNPHSRILVTGCLVAKDYTKISKIRGIDYIVSKGFFADSISDFKGRTRAFLKIQDGCDNFCSYCKVPYVRGRPYSRPEKQVLKEAVLLTDRGFKEIVLTGICLGSYAGLPRLLKKLEKIPGLLRIRLSSIEAGDIKPQLVDVMNKSAKICPHLHVPIQSGDDVILKRMHRSYTQRDYLSLIRKAKKAVKGLSITTDVIVGFPGETEAQFENTISLVKAIEPLKVHIFPYSQRAGTLAANFANAVPGAVIRQRISRLKSIAENLSFEFKRQFINKAVLVLIEGQSKAAPDCWEGYTGNYIKVIVSAKSHMFNKMARVKLKSVAKEAMLAEFCCGQG